MSTQTTAPARMLDAKAFMSILNSRITIKTDNVGQQVLLAVQGNGTFLPKGHKYTVNGTDRENQFDRTIYNLRANSQLSMLRDENKQLLSDAIKAESAGNTEEAHKLFNDYLNAIQVSFSVIEPSSRKFASGDMVTAVVGEAISEAGSKQLVVNDVRYKAPVTLTKTTFDITDLINSEEGADVFTKPAVTA